MSDCTEQHQSGVKAQLQGHNLELPPMASIVFKSSFCTVLLYCYIDVVHGIVII